MINTSSDFKENHFDTIIIGSGVGGLSAAICLARAGQKVLVLEQHDVPGGWCHSFYLNGHRFTPGVHYVGLLEKGQSTAQLYEGLGIANDLTFFRMNPSAYEHAYIGNERFDFPGNFDALVKSLIERFPKEEKNIKKWEEIFPTFYSLSKENKEIFNSEELVEDIKKLLKGGC